MDPVYPLARPEHAVAAAGPPALGALQAWAGVVPLGLYLLQQQHFVWVNPQFAQDSGHPAAALLGAPRLALVHHDDVHLVAHQLQLVAATSDPRSFEYRYRTASGEIRWAQETLAAVPYRGGRALMGSVHDCTADKQVLAAFAHQAFHDALTGLPNRALFADRLGAALARRERLPGEVAVLYLDLDDFKAVNDERGHHAGDALLSAVAERLVQQLRPSDTLARLGGDEFTVLLEGTTADWAAGIATRLLGALAAPVVVTGHALQVSASLGLALSSATLASAEALLQAADRALYAAKAQGKGKLHLAA